MKRTKEDLRETVFEVPSSSGNGNYTVTLLEKKDGKAFFFCTCPSWRYNNNPKDQSKARVCKHIQKVLQNQVHPNTARKLEEGSKGGVKV